MSPVCDCCRENINKLNHQVSVMRKEIKNLRYVHITSNNLFENKCSANLWNSIIMKNILSVILINHNYWQQLLLISIIRKYYSYVRCVFNRQMLDSAVRANRKHMMAIQSTVSTTGLRHACKGQTTPTPSPDLSHAALEKGNRSIKLVIILEHVSLADHYWHFWKVWIFCTSKFLKYMKTEAVKKSFALV